MPTRHDYTMAMQNPGIRFNDPELVNGSTVLNGSGQPSVYSGQYASVYRLTCDGRNYAVRCFINDNPERQRRYVTLTDHLSTQPPASFVNFTYLNQEMLVNGERHPVVKMDWVEGNPLDKFVNAHRNNAGILRALSVRWIRVMDNLQSMGIAHNDLQHGNIIVTPTGDIVMVDYDAVFLPAFKGERSPEGGHRNYQHPRRTDRDYNASIDNFPALVIYLSLKAVASDPTLWDRFHREDGLLFTEDDLSRPGGTSLWSALSSIPDTEVRRLTKDLANYCRGDISQVPPLAEVANPQKPASRPDRLVLKSTVGPVSSPQKSSRSAQPLTNLGSLTRERVPTAAQAARTHVNEPTAQPSNPVRPGEYWVATTSAVLFMLSFPGIGSLILYMLYENLAMTLVAYLTVVVTAATLYFCYFDRYRSGRSALRRAAGTCCRNGERLKAAFTMPNVLEGLAVIGLPLALLRGVMRVLGIGWH